MSIFRTPLGPKKFWVLTLETPPRGVGGPEPNYGPLSDIQVLALTVGLWFYALLVTAKLQITDFYTNQ